MTSSTSNQSIEDKLYEATRMPQPRPEFLVDLGARLAAEPAHPPTRMVRLKVAFRRTSNVVVFSVLLIFIAVFLMVGPQKVIATVQQIIGYLPGIGFVENTESARVLSEPVSVSQNGVTVTVEEAVADAKSTRIILRIEGLGSASKFYGKDNIPSGPRLVVLPYGNKVDLQSWSVDVNASSLFFKLLYAPMGESILDATLIFDQVPWAPSGDAPHGIQIPLHFRKDQINGRILDATPVTLSSPAQQGITMVLESVVQTPGMVVLKVRLETHDGTIVVGPNWTNKLLLEDQNGRNHYLSVTSSLGQNGFDTSDLQTPILEPGAQYTLRLKGPIEVFKNIPAGDKSSRFTLLLGANPQPGQSWKLDQTIGAAGYTFHLSAVQLLAGNACSSPDQVDGAVASLVLDFDPHPGTTSLMVTPLSPSPGTRIYEECLAYKNNPSGLEEFRISSFSYMVEGNWEIKWQIPAK